MSERQSNRQIRGLRVPKEAEEALLNQMDRASGGHDGHEKRRESREPYRQVDGIPIQLTHDDGGGDPVDVIVVPRNISIAGLVFLHGNFLHPGTECSILLRALDGQAVRVPAEIVRSTHIQGTAHEIGVKFKKQLEDLSSFVSTRVGEQDAREQSSEQMVFTGEVLYIESQDDRELVRFLLCNQGIDTLAAANPDEALRVAKETQLDLIITAFDLPGMPSLGIVRALREAGHKCPIIGVTADRSEEAKRMAVEKGCTSVLVRPFGLLDLLDIIREHLPRRGAARLAAAQSGNIPRS